jgi:hypothetical protein
VARGGAHCTVLGPERAVADLSRKTARYACEVEYPAFFGTTVSKMVVWGADTLA